MKYSIILRVKALMLLGYSVKYFPCSCQWHLLSDTVLLAWAVASITLIYPLPLGPEMIIGVKYSLGAAIFIDRLHKVLFPLSAVEMSCSSSKSFTRRDKIQSAPPLLLPLSLVLAFPSWRALVCHQCWAKAACGSTRHLPKKTSRQRCWGFK